MNHPAPQQRYRTVLFKLSGELLGGEKGFGIDPDAILSVSKQLAAVSNAGVKVGIVIGGGNFFRGAQHSELMVTDVRKHQMGMLFTVCNALALEQTLISLNSPAAVQSAVDLPSVVQRYDAVSFQKHFDENRIVIFAGGTGNTHVTTDTAASLRAIEIQADVLLKATKVDGIYSADPVSNPSAIHYTRLTYDEVLSKNLAVMDAASVALCRQHSLPIRVFDASVQGGIEQCGLGVDCGTLVTGEIQS